MSYNLTLVASEHSPALDEDHFIKIEELCIRHGLEIESNEIEWSPDGQAGRLKISDNASMDLMKEMRSILSLDEIDCGVVREDFQPTAIFSDWEGTGTETECLAEMAKKRGVWNKVEELMSSSLNGGMDFAQSVRARVELVKGMPVKELKEVRDTIEPTPGYLDLIEDIKNQGGLCVVLTGGFTYFLDEFSEEWGFDHGHANVFEIDENECLTGEILGDIVDKPAKAAFVQHYLEQYSLTHEGTIGTGDGDNDLDMAKEVELFIGYRPKQIVLDSVLNCIQHGDHNAARYFISPTMDLSLKPEMSAQPQAMMSCE